jgi:hypothetical protein
MKATSGTNKAAKATSKTKNMVKELYGYTKPHSWSTAPPDPSTTESHHPCLWAATPWNAPAIDPAVITQRGLSEVTNAVKLVLHLRPSLVLQRLSAA